MAQSSVLKKGIVFIVSAPSGAGKTTLVEKYILDHPHKAQRSISCTTRLPRPGEENGKDYIFLKDEEFKKKLQRDEFIEHVRIFDHYYGTLKKTVEDTINQGKHLFLVIDTKGALLIKEKMKAELIFIMPPSLDVLRSRLIRRETETEEERNKRLLTAKEEMKKASSYDKIIVNDDLEIAYKEFKDFIHLKESQQSR